MAYIIDNAHILKGERLNNLSLLIEDNRVKSTRTTLKMYKHLRMDADDYIMTPTHVLLDYHLPLTQPFETRKDYYLEKFIEKGSTTVITCFRVHREREFPHQLKKIHSQMLDCPLDYVLGVRIPAKLLTQSFLMQCKRAKIPAIFIEVNSTTELNEVPWGWVKQVMFPYNSPLIPIFQSTEKKVRKTWANIMKNTNLPSLIDPIQELTPLSRNQVEKIGIFPVKSNLHDGGEVSYNFYLKDSGTVKMIESELFMHHDSKLLITMHKGKVIRAGKKMIYRPGFGEYVEIKTPSFYQSPT